MRVMVLGGTRFIGAAIVEELHAHGHELLIVHRGEHEPADRVPQHRPEGAAHQHEHHADGDQHPSPAYARSPHAGSLGA